MSSVDLSFGKVPINSAFLGGNSGGRKTKEVLGVGEAGGADVNLPFMVIA